MLTEETVIDSIFVDEHGNVHVRRAHKVLRDGEEIAKSFHRHVLEPGANLTGEDPRVSAIAQAAWQEY